MKIFKSNKISEEDALLAKYKEYQEYVQPSSVLPGELSPYKSLLVKYADLVEENKELKALVADLQSELNENKELSV
jgi:cell shape-determining protein MreC